MAFLALLIWGIQMPVITLKELVFWEHTLLDVFVVAMMREIE